MLKNLQQMDICYVGHFNWNIEVRLLDLDLFNVLRPPFCALTVVEVSLEDRFYYTPEHGNYLNQIQVQPE